MIPEPQRCSLSNGRDLARITVAYITAMAVIAGIVALAVTR